MLTILQKAKLHRFLVVELNAIANKSESYRNVSQEDVNKLNDVYRDLLIKIRLGMNIPIHEVYDLEDLIESLLRGVSYVARQLREITRLRKESNLIPATYLKIVSRPQDHIDVDFFKIQNAFMLELDCDNTLQEEARFVEEMLPYIEGNLNNDDLTLIKETVTYILSKESKATTSVSADPLA